MNNELIIQRLKDIGALREGHFSEADGSCSRVRVTLNRLFQRPEETGLLVSEMVPGLLRRAPEMVVGVGEESMILAYELARQLNARCLYAFRHNGTMTVRRELDIAAGGGALIAAHSVSTGRRIRETVELLRALDVRILGITSVLDLSEGKAHFRFPFEPLISVATGNRSRKNCPLCRMGVPFDRE